MEIGVEEEGLELARLRIRGLNRKYIRVLVREGFTNEECLKEVAEEELAKILPERLVQRIKKRINSENCKLKTDNCKPETCNPKPATSNLKLKTDNRQPKTILEISQHRPDRIIFQGKEIKVTARGFSLLYLLAQHKNEVVSYDNILDEIWKKYDEDAIYTRIIQHICKFRRDLLDAIGDNKTNKEKVKDIFKVVSGRGVMLNINDKELKIN